MRWLLHRCSTRNVDPVASQIFSSGNSGMHMATLALERGLAVIGGTGYGSTASGQYLYHKGQEPKPTGRLRVVSDGEEGRVYKVE